MTATCTCPTCGKAFESSPGLHRHKSGGNRRKFCSVECRNAPRLQKSLQERRDRYAQLKQMGARPDRAAYGSASIKRRDEILRELGERNGNAQKTQTA